MAVVFSYVVTSYHEPEQLYRLLGALRRDSPGSRILVSHDRKSPDLDVARLAGLGATHVRTPRPVTWGDPTYLDSVLAALALLEVAEQDWVTLLSGQDYPLRDVAEYEAHLASCGADALLELPATTPHERVLRRRYRSRIRTAPVWLRRGRYVRLVNAVPGLSYNNEPHGRAPTIESRRLRTPFGASLRLHRGADLFAVNGRGVAALLGAPPALLDYFRHTNIPSEAFPHTVLRNDPDLAVRDEAIHHTRWGWSAHPEWLGQADLAAAAASGCWFARKFLPDDPALAELDRVRRRSPPATP